jgi:threonine/homoserine/homoserine lactone efflux protein
MPDPAALLVFMTAAFVLLVVPGPAVLYITARSLEQGRAAGFVSILGIGLGTVVHILAAALGLTAVLASSPAAFHVLRYLGAAYLVYLGVRRLAAGDALDLPGVRRESLGALFRQGVVVNLLNPKATLFIFAFLPQFVDPARGSAPRQILFLGAVFLVMGFVTDSLWALAAGTLGDWFRRSRRLRNGQRFVSGGMLVALGLAAALTGAGRT